MFCGWWKGFDQFLCAVKVEIILKKYLEHESHKEEKWKEAKAHERRKMENDNLHEDNLNDAMIWSGDKRS